MAEKKTVKKKRTSQKWKLFKVEGGKLSRVNKQCPKCGKGVFLASHNDRLTCGTCGYMEVKSEELKNLFKSKEQPDALMRRHGEIEA